MTDTSLDAPKPELSRIANITELDKKGLDITVEATAEECDALAERFRIVSISALSGTAHLRPENDDEVVVSGRVEAVVEQACVVTQEPVREEISEDYEIRFSPHADEMEMPDLSEDQEIDPALLDLPEPLVGGQIDVGEVIAQEVALSLNPYPRKDGAELSHPALITEEQAKQGSNPFAQLAGLKDKLAQKTDG